MEAFPEYSAGLSSPQEPSAFWVLLNQRSDFMTASSHSGVPPFSLSRARRSSLEQRLRMVSGINPNNLPEPPPMPMPAPVPAPLPNPLPVPEPPRPPDMPPPLNELRVDISPKVSP